MKRKQIILGIILGIIYYALGIMGFPILFACGIFGVIPEFSEILFWTLFLVIPFIILLLPIALKVIPKKEFYKSILWSLLAVSIHFILIVSISFGIQKYMSKFTKEKWANENYTRLRYLMIDDLEKQYNFVGKSKEEIMQILGEGEEYNCSTYYLIGTRLITSDYYCLVYETNGIVKEAYVTSD